MSSRRAAPTAAPAAASSDRLPSVPTAAAVAAVAAGVPACPTTNRAAPVTRIPGSDASAAASTSASAVPIPATSRAGPRSPTRPFSSSPPGRSRSSTALGICFRYADPRPLRILLGQGERADPLWFALCRKRAAGPADTSFPSWARYPPGAAAVLRRDQAEIQ